MSSYPQVHTLNPCRSRDEQFTGSQNAGGGSAGGYTHLQRAFRAGPNLG